MSQPMNAAATATGTDVSAAKNNVVEGADEHTPDVSKHEPPAEKVPDPTDGDSAKDDAAGVISALARRVEILEEASKAAARKVDPDTPPVKRVPWTERGRKRK